MSLARALTTRMRDRFEQVQSAPNRTFSTRAKPDKPFDRKLISLPVELISCSNVLAYEAPDIGKITANMNHDMHAMSEGSQPTSPSAEDITSPMSSASSTKSWDDPLASPALTSASSVTSHEDSRECSPANPDPNPMSSFFFDSDPVQKKSLRETKQSFASRQSTATTATTDSTTPPTDSEPIPDVPKRSLTHTKQTHQVLAHQRSVSRLSDARKSAESGGRVSSDHSTENKSELDHPFGAELEKVNELVEELATASNAEPEIHVVDEETQYLIDNGFGYFTANDYIAEIQPLFFKAYGQSSMPNIQEWI